MGRAGGMEGLTAGTAVVVLVLQAAQPLRAQMSPNCERNGRRTACAYTPWPASSTAEREAGRIVFADHSIMELQLDLGSCSDQGNQRSCRAWMRSPAGSELLLPASYRGTALEGAYRHTYSDRNLRITYWVLD